MTPNRYSVPFLLAATGLNNVSKLNPLKLEPRKLLLIWYKGYKYKSILISFLKGNLRRQNNQVFIKN